MEGITILSQVVETYTPFWRMLTDGILVAILVISFATGYAFLMDDTNMKSTKIIASTICSILIIVSGSLTFSHFYNKTGEWEYIKYKVLIDDSVSFNYIYDNYDVGSIEGKIITLRDKDYDVNPKKR